jgi:hypothetical protein
MHSMTLYSPSLPYSSYIYTALIGLQRYARPQYGSMCILYRDTACISRYTGILVYRCAPKLLSLPPLLSKLVLFGVV